MNVLLQVKLVLAAAMWNKPHVLILDEPTNYLDRQALGALTQAIKTFSGGVVIISHNSVRNAFTVPIFHFLYHCIIYDFHYAKRRYY